MGFFSNLFKSKEEKERIEYELARKKEEEIELEYKSKAQVEAEKITKKMVEEIKEFIEEYGGGYFYTCCDTSHIIDEKLKIYTILFVANKFEMLYGLYEYKDIELLLNNQAEKSKYYYKMYVQDESYSLCDKDEIIKEDEDNLFDNNGNPVIQYYIKTIKFERYYAGYEFIVLKNKIYYNFHGSR